MFEYSPKTLEKMQKRLKYQHFHIIHYVYNVSVNAINSTYIAVIIQYYLTERTLIIFIILL